MVSTTPIFLTLTIPTTEYAKTSALKISLPVIPTTFACPIAKATCGKLPKREDAWPVFLICPDGYYADNQTNMLFQRTALK